MNPKLRPHEAHWIEHNGRPAILLRDRGGLSDHAVVVPQPLVVLLSLCDGTRDVATLRTAFELRTGVRVEASMIDHVLDQLDEALLLDTPRAEKVEAQALEKYRSASFRPQAGADLSYPSDSAELGRMLHGYLAAASPDGGKQFATPIRGLISPHIDFQRGGNIYAATWRLAADAVRAADVAVVFGTDHTGGPGEITLTRQNYATPYGALPTARYAVDAVAEAIGQHAAFASELNHVKEHSIELAAIWLHHFLGTSSCELVPILCGSFQPFTDGLQNPAEFEKFALLVGALRESLRGKRTLVVAAADLAHVGLAFGDSYAFGQGEKEALARADADLLAAAASGDAEAFIKPLVAEADRRRVCGLPPIYLALRLMGDARGCLVDYAQCPADQNDASWVSIAGMVFS